MYICASWKNENLIIYVGTAIFFILAISVGIVMYMTTKANSKVGNETGKSITENIENIDSYNLKYTTCAINIKLINIVNKIVKILLTFSLNKLHTI